MRPIKPRTPGALPNCKPHLVSFNLPTDQSFPVAPQTRVSRVAPSFMYIISFHNLSWKTKWSVSMNVLFSIQLTISHHWAATWQNQQYGCAASEDSDQPGHPPSLISLPCPHEESLGPEWATHWAHSEDSDKTGRMPRLIWVFAGRTLILLVLSCRVSH